MCILFVDLCVGVFVVECFEEMEWVGFGGLVEGFGYGGLVEW